MTPLLQEVLPAYQSCVGACKDCNQNSAGPDSPISMTLAVLISYRSVPMILESYFVFLTLIHLELGWLQLQSYTFNTLPSLVLKLMPILQATLELVLSSVVY